MYVCVTLTNVTFDCRQRAFQDVASVVLINICVYVYATAVTGNLEHQILLFGVHYMVVIL